MSYTHRQKYNARCEIPPPITGRLPPKIQYPILRPIISQLDYRTAARSLDGLFTRLSEIATQAKFNLDITPPSQTSILQPDLAHKSSENTPFVETLLRSLTSSVHASASVSVPATSTTLRITLRTHSHGTEYSISIASCVAQSPLSSVPKDSTFNALADLEHAVCHFLLLDLVHLAAQTVDAPASADGGWDVSSAHAGELKTVPTLDGIYAMIQIDLSRERLELVSRDTEEEGMRFTWDGKDGVVRRGFVEELELLRFRTW